MRRTQNKYEVFDNSGTAVYTLCTWESQKLFSRYHSCRYSIRFETYCLVSFVCIPQFRAMFRVFFCISQLVHNANLYMYITLGTKKVTVIRFKHVRNGTSISSIYGRIWNVPVKGSRSRKNHIVNCTLSPCISC